MYWTFDFGWFLSGFVVMAAGVLVVRFHKQIADSLASGVSSYNKVKLFGLIMCGVGFIFITNLHSTIIRFIMHMIAPNKF
jgi:hypothetical protein